MADLAVAGEGLGTAPRRPLAAAFAAEGDRRILWLPVFFATGVALYFALTIEPPWWISAVCALAAAGLAVALRRRQGWRDGAIALAFVAAGFAVITQARIER